MPEDRRLAAIMFTDIVGYTALMGSDEDKAFRVLRKNREIQRPIIKKYHGEWLKEMGDGILASFNTASDAVRCAGEIQQAAKKEGIGLRIGIHEGEVVFEGSDVLGDGVNVASRLEELAEEGTINISGAVYKDIKNKAGIVAEFIEDKELKNVEEPIKVYRVKYEEMPQEVVNEKTSNSQINKPLLYIIGGLTVIIIVILIWQFLPAKKSFSERTDIGDKSIAVLPFTNDSPDEENEYFCNGMMEDILTNLQKISDLKVKSRTDVEQYRNIPKTIAAMGEELGVAYILEGSVRKASDNLRITAQLIDVQTGDHLWANTYDGKYTDEIFKFQSDVAEMVASSLKAVITPEEEKSIGKAPTMDIKAYDFVKRGWSNLVKYQNTYNEEYSRKSIGLFKKAIEFDSTYIEAYPVLISLYMNSFNLDSMIYFINKLKMIDPNNVGGYYFNGVYLMWTNKADMAIEELTRALQLDNDHIWVKVALGSAYCRFRKEYDQGIPYIMSAIEECPESTKNTMYSWLINTLIHIGEYEKAEQYLQKSMEIQAGCYEIISRNFILTSQGKYELAKQFTDSICNERQCISFCDWGKFNYNFNLREFSKCEEYYNLFENASTFHPMLIGWTKINWAYVCNKLNRNEESNAIIEEVILSSQSQLEKGYSWSLLDLSRIYAFKNDKEKSIRYLIEYEKVGFSHGYHDYIQIDPLFENLKDDPDFLAIVHRVQKDKAESRDKIQKLIQEGLL